MSTAERAGTPPTQAMPTSGSGAPGASVARTAPSAGAVAPAAAPTASAQTAQTTPTAPTAANAAAPKAVKAPVAAPRRIRLTVSRVDPWSTAKVAFLLSVAFGIAMVVMTAVLWTFLNGMGVFTKVNSMIGSVIQEGGRPFDIMDFVGFWRIISLSIVFAVIDVLLLTTLATLAAFLYNVSSSLVGGVQMTLSDE